VAVAVGEAGGTAPSVSMIADSYPREQRSRAMSIFMLGPHLGLLFGLGLGAWIAQRYGWRAAFLSMAVPGVIAGLLLRFTAFEPARGLHEAVGTKIGAAQESFSVMLKDLRGSPAFVRIVLAGMFLGFAGYAIGIWSTTFLVRSHGLSLRDAGTLMGLAGGTAAIIGALLSGWLTDRLARRDARWQLGVPALGTLLAVPFGLMFYMAPAGVNWSVAGIQVPQSMPVYLCFSVLSVWWAAPAYAALTNIVRPDRRSTAMALYNLALTTVGGGLGPLSVGMLSDALTPLAGAQALRWSLVAMILVYLLAVLVYLLALKPYAKAMQEAPTATPVV
jgi:MFS family permease